MMEAPQSLFLAEGLYEVEFPAKITLGGTVYTFLRWEDGSSNPVIRINLTIDLSIKAYYVAFKVFRAGKSLRHVTPNPPYKTCILKKGYIRHIIKV